MDKGSNAALVRRFFDEVLNGRRLDRLEEFFAPNFRENPYWHSPVTYPGGAEVSEPMNMSLEDIRQEQSTIQKDFPQSQYTIDELIEAGDRVVYLTTFKGTFRNGMPVSTKGIYILRFEDGKIAEQTYQFDRLGQFQQVGVLPESRELIAKLPPAK